MGLIAIGDIHGCVRTLDDLLNEVAPTSSDTLVLIGDYVDRGPDSRGVIDRVLALEQELDCVFLRGNHEAMMLDYLDEGALELWTINGGMATLRSYLSDDGDLEIPDEHVDFLRRTTLYHDTPDFLFVHAGLLPNLTIAENLEEGDETVFLWTRAHMSTRAKLEWEKTVVCGHTPVETPINKPLLINVDTGCVYHNHPLRGRLTAVRLPEREFVSVRYSG